MRLGDHNLPLKFAIVGYDFGSAFAAFIAAFLIAHWPQYQAPTVSVALNAVVYAAIVSAAGIFNHQHRQIWRYTSLADCFVIAKAALLGVLLYLPIVFLATRAVDLPRSVPPIACFLTIALQVSPRIVLRAWKDHRPFANGWVARRNSLTGPQIPVLLAGKAARIEALLRGRSQGESPYSIAGLLTYEKEWHNRRMYGVPVLGGVDTLQAATAGLALRGVKVQRLVVADDEISEHQLQGFLDSATKQGLTLGKLPRLANFDSMQAGQLDRPVALGDLLGRPQNVQSLEPVRGLIAGRRVLVTGAGGSIGSELVRQIATFGPKRIILVENSEFNLYSIEKELGEKFPHMSCRAVLCDVRDFPALEACFNAERPEIVFHAAALKHVPLVEANASEGVRTNVMGTRNVAEACTLYGVGAMVLISSDKAVNPHNVMGSTKRMAESLLQAMDVEQVITRFVAVRFGNVLGSAGSVVPLFQRQLDAGGPLTVTHPEITRYFMTIPEAVQLVLQASSLGAAPDAARGCVYVLDMGPPVKILDLARQMVRLAGKQPDVDIKIEFVGLRPGEKLYEEIVHGEERAVPTARQGIDRITPRSSSLSTLRQQIGELTRATDSLDDASVRRILKIAVPEYVDSSNVADL